jgi:succinate-semialdehyde dehydrogenase/glutarate-semialdehyde dehydrogenase
MAALRVGKGTVKGVDVGPLVDRKARESVDALVQEAVAGGAKILTGGGPLPGKGWFYAPTVLTDVPASSRIAVEEIFGPVAPISTFATEAEAIARANDTAYGLVAGAAAIWRARCVSEELEFGMVGTTKVSCPICGTA